MCAHTLLPPPSRNRLTLLHEIGRLECERFYMEGRTPTYVSAPLVASLLLRIRTSDVARPRMVTLCCVCVGADGSHAKGAASTSARYCCVLGLPVCWDCQCLLHREIGVLSGLFVLHAAHPDAWKAKLLMDRTWASDMEAELKSVRFLVGVASCTGMGGGGGGEAASCQQYARVLTCRRVRCHPLPGCGGGGEHHQAPPCDECRREQAAERGAAGVCVRAVWFSWSL